jgi:hypothetical protein
MNYTIALLTGCRQCLPRAIYIELCAIVVERGLALKRETPLQ